MSRIQPKPGTHPAPASDARDGIVSHRASFHYKLAVPNRHAQHLCLSLKEHSIDIGLQLPDRALMGGEITKAVEDVRAKGLLVISLNMAGSVPDAADLVVSDPVQAGVMAVMAVADTATFDIVRQQKRRY